MEAWEGVGFVGRTGVGVPLPVACAGVGLVGLKPLGVALGSPVGREESSPFVAGRTTSGLAGTLLPSAERNKYNDRSLVHTGTGNSHVIVVFQPIYKKAKNYKTIPIGTSKSLQKTTAIKKKYIRNAFSVDGAPLHKRERRITLQ